MMNYTSPSGLNFGLYEKNDAPTDLLFFITLFLERGNNISKILLKCDQEMGSLIRRKASSYGIVMERKQSSTVLGTSSLTLARLTQAFPIATAAVILKHKINGKLKTKALVGILELPILLQHTIFPSLIPIGLDEDLADDLKAVALVLNIETSILLSTPKEKRKLESKDVDELSNQAEQYVSAAMSGSLVSDNAKLSILQAAAIIDSKHKLTLEARACVAAAKAFLQLGSKTFSRAVKARVEELKPKE